MKEQPAQQADNFTILSKIIAELHITIYHLAQENARLAGEIERLMERPKDAEVARDE